MKDNGEMIRGMEKGMKFTLTEMCTQAISSMERQMGKESTSGRQERFMMESGVKE
jgi:hypothetical protein